MARKVFFSQARGESGRTLSWMLSPLLLFSVSKSEYNSGSDVHLSSSIAEGVLEFLEEGWDGLELVHP